MGKYLLYLSAILIIISFIFFVAVGILDNKILTKRVELSNMEVSSYLIKSQMENAISDSNLAKLMYNHAQILTELKANQTWINNAYNGYLMFLRQTLIQFYSAAEGSGPDINKQNEWLKIEHSSELDYLILNYMVLAGKNWDDSRQEIRMKQENITNLESKKLIFYIIALLCNSLGIVLGIIYDTKNK